MLYGFLHDWRQRGIQVEEPQRQKLYKLLGEWRAELVPAEDLRAAMDCWKRQAADSQSRRGPLELGEPSSAEEASLPSGVRQFGQGIMRRHPPENWLNVVEDVSSSWRFAEGVAGRFKTWMAREQGARAAAINAQPTAPNSADDPPAAGAGNPPNELALAPQEAEQATESEGKPDEAKGSEAPDSASENAEHLSWVNFDAHMESEGMLYYRVNQQWWKVPVKTVKYHGKDEYDLRGAVKFEPTYLQDMLLNHGGWLDETGWDIVVRHYVEEYGPSSFEQLRKDLASLDADEAGKKFIAAVGPELLFAVLLGAAAEKLRKIVSPTFRKAYEILRKRLDKLTKQSRKKTEKELAKELAEVAEDLRNLANRETDVAAKREANAIADELEEKATKAKKPTGDTPDDAPPKRLPPIKKPPFPKPQSETRYTWKGHKTAAEAEERLARKIHELPDEAVVRWGDPIGANGADVTSVNVRTGEVTLWDSKFRSAPTTIKPSPTFSETDRLDRAIAKAKDTITANTTLPADIRETALKNLKARKVTTRTAGEGNAKNSTLK